MRFSKLWVASFLCALLISTVLPAAAAELEEQVAAEIDSLVEIYKHLHASPELSYQEKESAALVARELRELGFEVTEEVGDYGVEGRVAYGVVGVMRNGDGPTVMVRTDLDALPIEEKTGLSYASRATGVSDSGGEVLVMQACGHDLHMTTFVGTARMLTRIKDRWRGTLVMIGQPAEERGAGARAMLDDGLFERFPKPEYALAFHANAEMPAGKVGMVSGYALANVDSVDITIRGRGGHGAYPHKTKDPVMLAAQVIVNLQPIVSRQVSPFDPAVVTVGSIHGGTKHNIIPDEVRLQLTVRTYKPEVREQVLASIRQVAEDTARAAGFPDELLPVVELAEEEYTPSTYNDPELTKRLAAVLTQTLGEDRVRWVEPVMAGEDFARYGIEGEIPITLMWLGAVEPARVEDYAERGQQLPPLHSAEFTVFPEPAIRTGVTAMTAAVLDLMQP